MSHKPTAKRPAKEPRAFGRASPQAPRVDREWCVILGLTLFGAVLRLWSFGRLGLTHFDEGVYAFGGLWSVAPGGLSPELIAYAPPGLPILVGLAYLAFGVSDSSALLVSVVTGVLTVPAVGWLARRTFGGGAGALAAGLTALSIAHVAFSRKALTDAPFLLAWVVAIGLGGRFLERPGAGRAVALGLAVGTAQNMKYYGWLSGAITILAAVAGLVRHGESRERATVYKTFGWGAVAVVVALAMYLPWFRFVERNGGYADLLRHQRGYFLGAWSWLANWRQQIGQVAALSGGPAWRGGSWFLASSIASACLSRTLTANGVRSAEARGAREGTRILNTVHAPSAGSSRFRSLSVVGLGTVGMIFIPELGWWLGLAWAPRLLFDAGPSRRIVGAWWVAMSLLTPLYYPYARLWLPIDAACWVILSGYAALAFREGPPALASRSGVCSALVALLLAAVVVSRRGDRPTAFPPGEMFAPTDGVKLAVSRLSDDSALTDRSVARLAVYARRPFAFYLSLHGRLPFRMASGMNSIVESPGDWALIDAGVDAANLSGPSPPGLANLSQRLDLGRPMSTFLDPVTRLDVFPATAFGVSNKVAPLYLLRPLGLPSSAPGRSSEKGPADAH